MVGKVEKKQVFVVQLSWKSVRETLGRLLEKITSLNLISFDPTIQWANPCFRMYIERDAENQYSLKGVEWLENFDSPLLAEYADDPYLSENAIVIMFLTQLLSILQEGIEHFYEKLSVPPDKRIILAQLMQPDRSTALVMQIDTGNTRQRHRILSMTIETGDTTYTTLS